MRRGFLAVVLLITLLSPAPASEDAAADLAACRTLVRKKRWKKALEAYAELFRTHREAPEITAARRDIEDDLKTCSFRAVYRPVTPKDFWGEKHVRKFSASSLKVELDYPRPAAPWSKQNKYHVLNIRFRDHVTVEIDGPPMMGRRPLIVILCFDIEKEGGYALLPGRHAGGKPVAGSVPTTIARMEDGKVEPLFQRYVKGSDTRHKFVRDSSSIRLFRGRKQIAKAIDRHFSGGYIAVGEKWPEKVTISGRLDEGYWRKLAGEHEARAFATWQKDSWDPAKAIPAWVRKPGATSAPKPAAKRATLPPDATPCDTRQVSDLIDRSMNGDRAAVRDLAKIARMQPGTSRAYLEGVCAVGAGRFAASETQLAAVVAAEAGFAPARALLGLVRMILRRMEEAAADLTAARDADPALGWAWFGLVQLAIYDGDLDRASKLLDGAQAAGAKSPFLDGLPEVVHRSKRGPLWARRFDHGTKHFRIASDHSKDLCEQVGQQLEAAVASYATYFPTVKMPARKARVYVFATRAGYLRYARAVAKDLAFSAGAYDPRVRELVLFLPVNRKHFVHTIRHEGFHAFVHEYLERAPLWFNEGAAEYFAAASKGYGVGLKFGAPHETALARLRAWKDRLVPVEKLLTMERQEFMANAPLHYSQSWAIVHYMLKSRGERMRNAFRGYFKALRQGKSQEDAYRRHLSRHVERIEKGYREHISGM
ncbi:MAG: DUF1570 domain-containing protein [Planctomycetota bacterium]